MKDDKKLQKPDWFNIENYENPSYLDPGHWALQLEVRQELLSEINNKELHHKDIDPRMLMHFDAIKKKGLLGLDWNFPDLSLASIGIMDSKSNIDRFDNSALNYAETIRQEQAKNNFYTNTVYVPTAYELFDTANFMEETLKASIMRMKSLKSGIGKERTKKDERDIELACELYPTGKNFNGLSYIQVDLTAPDELILEDFKKVLNALQSKEDKLSERLKRSKAMKVNAWLKNNFSLFDSGILPYLDLLIYSKIKNKHLTDSVADEIVFGHLHKPPTDKIKKTTKKLAKKMIQENQIEALRILYMSQPPSYWKEKSK